MSIQNALDTPVQEGTGLLHILDPTGDQQVTWNRNDPTQVDIAMAAYNDAIRRGYMGYKVTADGRRGEVLRQFDRAAERIILAPAMQGGSGA